MATTLVTATQTNSSDNASGLSTADAPAADTTRPVITAIAYTGLGIDADGNGDLNQGHAVTVTLTISKPVYISGSTPELLISNAEPGDVFLSSGSGTDKLVFSFNIGSYPVMGPLSVLSFINNGATITDAAGNPIDRSLNNATTPSGTLTIDTISPDYYTSSVFSASGKDIGAGKVVTITFQTELVTVAEANGGPPTLRLSDGEVATYTGPVGSPVSSLTYSYTVLPGDSGNLVVNAINALPVGTTIKDGAGNDADPLYFRGVDTGIKIDTSPPFAFEKSITVVQNSGPTRIGVNAPSDDVTPASLLAIAVNGLPTNGTMTMADGTAIVLGQSLTMAQLFYLNFTPTLGVSGQGSSFTYTVTDGAGNVSTAAVALNIGGPSAPTIAGTHATAIQAGAPVAPFAGVTVSDPSSQAGATETLTIALTGGDGALSEGAGYTGTPSLSGGGTAYQLTGTAAQVTAELDTLSFTPAAGAPGTTTSTTFVLTDQSSAGTSVVDSGTTVSDTAAAAPTPQPSPAPAPQPNPAPAPSPAPTPAPDTVSFSPQVTYRDGVFTLTGKASSAVGGGSVAISAVVDDGAREPLGTAAVNPDGTFTFRDSAAGQQGFFVATLTDSAGGTATSVDPGFSLTGGLGTNGGQGRQTRYSADGAAETAVTRFLPDGSQRVTVPGGEQTFASSFFDTFSNKGAPDTIFVFNPGFGRDVVDQFRVDGTDHDSLSFKGSDFDNNITGVLISAKDTAAGLLITDPTASSPGGGPGTHDKLLLKGITRQQLIANQQDITFHP